MDHPSLALMAWDHNRDFIAAWSKVLLSDPATSKYLAGTAFHWYSSDQPALNLYYNLDAAHAIDPTKFLLASESSNCPGVRLGDWSRGETYAMDIINDLNHWASGWVDWNLVMDTDLLIIHLFSGM